MDTQKLLFCHYYLKTCDAEMAARMAGYRELPPGEAVRLLAGTQARKMLHKLKESVRGGLDTYQAAMRLAELAFSPATDAIKLAFMPRDTPPEELDGLDLRQVAQICRKGDGTVEVKLVDRLEALNRLIEFLSGLDDGQGDSLMDALNAAADGHAEIS